MSELKSIRNTMREFAKERDWDQFHSPKNLSMALSVEACELMEHFQWISEEQSLEIAGDKLAAVADEVADIQLYLVRLADKLNIDIFEAVENKVIKNSSKYPVGKVKGSPKKYNEYE